MRTEVAGESGIILIDNETDADDNPAGGLVSGVGMGIYWQSAPRGRPDGSLEPASGAFVEDVILAAKCRLEFYQESAFACKENAEALKNLKAALTHLDKRRQARRAAGVEGVNTAIPDDQPEPVPDEEPEPTPAEPEAAA